MNTVDKVLKIASDEVGYLEKSASAWNKYGTGCLYKRTEFAGYDNYTKYGYEMHKLYPKTMDFPAAWCDAFVDWCFYAAYGDKDARRMLGGEFDDYTKASTDLYIKAERFYYAKTSKPKRGDQIFFSKNGTFSGIHHTGIVERVDKTRVYTIEGNTSTGDDNVEPNGGGVHRKSYLMTNEKIYGYGRPNYDVTGWHWVKAGGKWYWQDENGANAHGWVKIQETGGAYKHWYYFDGKGAMLTGLQTLPYKKDGKDVEGLFYLSEAGSLEGALCESDTDGALGVWFLP